MTCCFQALQTVDFMERFSEETRRRDQYDLDKIIAALESGRSIVDIAKDYDMIPEASEEAHLRSHWYNEDGNGWWPNYPVEDIVRGAYIHAIRLMQQLDLPIDAKWAPGGPGFAVSIAVSPEVEGKEAERVITMIIHTPPAPPDVTMAEKDMIDDPNVWIVEADKDGNVVTRACRRPR